MASGTCRPTAWPIAPARQSAGEICVPSSESDVAVAPMLFSVAWLCGRPQASRSTAVTDSLRAPDADEWQQFSRTVELRDMGTHLCALPAGEHCSRGLVCLGCSSAPPRSA